MSVIAKFVRRATGAALLGLAALSSHAALTTQLGFVIDGSGSIGATNFGIMKTGYATAFAGLPVDGSVEVTVVRFAGITATAIYSPTIIASAADRTNLISVINAMTFPAGGTPMTEGIELATSLMLGSTNYSAGLSSLINLATDGVPNNSATATAAAAAARAGGIDALTVEAIGGGVDLNYLRSSIVFSPSTAIGSGVILPSGAVGPNPMTSTAWVLPVDTFDDFGKAINAKVQAVVNPTPEPGSLALVGIAFAGFGLVARRRKLAAA